MNYQVRHEFTYTEGVGPERNGNRKDKPAIHPSINNGGEIPIDVNVLIGMAIALTDWGEQQWRNDHGTFADHQLLLNFINVAIDIAHDGYFKRNNCDGRCITNLIERASTRKAQLA